MRAFAFLAVLLAAYSLFAADATNSLQQFSPKFSANTRIVWAAPTNQLPKNFWIYKRLPPRPFSAAVIANAVALASMQDKKIPAPSTNSFFIWSKPNPCGMSYDVFSIEPASGTISFSSPDQNQSTTDIPSADAVMKRAFECAPRLGLNQAELMPQKVYGSSNAPGCETLTNGICGRGINFSRKLEGVCFYGDANNGSEGFSIEFGSRGQIRGFSFVWPNLERFQQSACLSPKQIIRCIQEQKIIVMPDDAEPNYFQRIKMLAHARAFTITKIIPVYGDSVFGEVPTNNLPAQFITPFADLEAEADLGINKTTVRLVSPIMLSEFNRLVLKPVIKTISK